MLTFGPLETLISKTAQYALRAAVTLALDDSGRPVRAHEIAGRLGVPVNYLSKILYAMARSDLLESERGPHGGFRLARPADEITLGEVLAPFDPWSEQRYCVFGRPECSDANPCPVHDHWKRVSEPVAVFFRETTLADLLADVEAGVTPGEGEKHAGT